MQLCGSLSILWHCLSLGLEWKLTFSSVVAIAEFSKFAGRVYPNSCLMSRWCHLIISSSVIPFSSCLQSFPTSGSFQTSQLFASGSQNIGVSASTSVLPMNTQDSFMMDWLDLLAVQGTHKSLLQHHSSKASILFFYAQLSL